jgi:hypothetical protein
MVPHCYFWCDGLVLYLLHKELAFCIGMNHLSGNLSLSHVLTMFRFQNIWIFFRAEKTQNCYVHLFFIQHYFTVLCYDFFVRSSNSFVSAIIFAGGRVMTSCSRMVGDEGHILTKAPLFCIFL